MYSFAFIEPIAKTTDKFNRKAVCAIPSCYNVTVSVIFAAITSF